MKEGFKIGGRTLVMGILNVTPDSFYDGGRYIDMERAMEHARRMCREGADIIDVGGESSRPGAQPVSARDEMERVCPVIERIAGELDVMISIDTCKAEVAEAAVGLGASMINDISALGHDPRMAGIAAASGAYLVLMHMKGTPRTMQDNPVYEDVIGEIASFLKERAASAVLAGVAGNRIILDPGIGFGKNVSHNLRLIRDLDLLHCLDRPILLGASRKRFIGAVLDKSVDDREVGTAVANSFAIHAGVHILRVHDVAYHRQVVRMGDALRSCPDFGETTG